jgi:tRNA(Ile)-lysidine synthase
MPNRDPFSAALVPDDFAPERPHLIGVSGGRDSIALLHWLVEKGYRDLTVCHVDHGLRPESAADAAFTRERALELGLKTVTRFADVRAFAAAKNLSLEAAARDARYAAFAGIAAEFHVFRLFLAHHADDQVETFLLQLMRGAGPGGLGGMAPVSVRRIEGVELRICRPLLGVWRAEIDEYVAERKLAYREDATNAELDHTRNRIRHVALPALKKAFGRDPSEALWRAAELLRAENELLAGSPALQSLAAELDVPWLRSFPLAMQRRIIHQWLKDGGITGVGYDEVEDVRSLLRETTAKVNLPGGRCARRREKRLFLDAQAG